MALLGIGMDPGLTDLFAKKAARDLFDEVHDVHVRDGGDMYIDGYAFATVFSIWTTIEECLNPPLLYEKERGWFTTEPFSGAERFIFPEGVGPVECVNVEHEEVALVPRALDVRRATFKYALGDEFIDDPPDAPQARPRFDEEGRAWATWRSRRVTSSWR